MAKKNSDEFSLDVSTFKNFFSKFSSGKSRALLIFLLIAVAFYFSVYFRMYSATLPVTDDWAYNNIYQSVRGQISAQVNQQYPNLPAANKNQLIDQQVQEFMRQQGGALDQQIYLMSHDLKSRFKDDRGQTYLLAIDPYLYIRYAENVLIRGHVGDSLTEEGRPFDALARAPFGGPTYNTFHPVFEAYWYRFLSLFGDWSLMETTFLVPVFISALAVIPAFFITSRRVGYFGGFIAAMIVAVHAAFLGRTAGGFADTDAYNVIFPLLVAWLFIEAFESDNWKKQVSLLLLNGFVMGLYSWAWSGWWYILYFLVGVVLVYAGFLVVKSYIQTKSFKKLWSKELKSALIVLVLFVAFSGIFVSLQPGPASFVKAIEGPFKFQVIKQAAKPDLWPNVYTTVAELNPASLNSIINQIGGKLLFFIASVGLIMTLMGRESLNKKDYLLLSSGVIIYALLVTDSFIRFSPITYLFIFLLPLAIGMLLLLKDSRDIDVKYALFLTIWFVGTIYASTKGTRFVLLLVPAYAIAFGIALGTVSNILSNMVEKEFKVNKKIVAGILMILLALLLINPIKAADRTAKGEIPSMNDAWWNSLTKIRDNSSEDAIITSWWDFGHWFKAIADRQVTFDGGSQNQPQAHWVGKILMNDNEEEAIGILRMLDCGRNTVFEEIDKKFDDTEVSVDIVYEVVNSDEAGARTLLADHGFTSSEIDTIVSFSHCDPPEAFFITSGDMVGKAGVWSHFGSWNFDRSFIYNNVRGEDYQSSLDLMMERFDFTEDQASNYFYDVQSLSTDREVNNWIAPWPSYATQSLRRCTNDSLTATCNLNVGLGESNLGQSVSLSTAVINLSDPQNSKFLLSFVDRTSGLTVAQQETKLKNLVVAGDTLETYDIGGNDIHLDVLYDQVRNRALVTHPSLTKSIFTKLFFLDGRYTTHFEEFSDATTVTGSRILIWKVDWDGNQENE